jgi:hypothetical protein
MKVCRVALVLTVGITARMSLGAQALPADPVLIASEAAPDFLGYTHPSLTNGLGIRPAISQPVPLEPTPEVPQGPLTAKDRLTLLWNESYASPGMFVGVAAGALMDQMRHTPAKWDGDGSGYTRRFASEYGQLATRNVIHDGLAGLTGTDPRYKPCACTSTLQRTAHAFKAGFLVNREDGRMMLDMPQVVSAYGSGIVSTYWYPHRQFSPLVQGVQFGHEQMGEVVMSNLVQEFGPSIQRRLHLHALTARRVERPDDDD